MGTGKSRLEKTRSKAEKKINERIDHRLWTDKENGEEVIKLLLLGAGESGKSTFFRQMIKLYGSGFEDKDLILHIPMIHNNTIQAIKELCFQSDLLGENDPRCLVQEEPAVSCKRFILDEVKTEDKINEQIARAVEVLWQHPGIKQTYEQRSKFQLIDTCNYFFSEIHRLAQPNYKPTENDLFHTRVRTTGIVERRFTIDDNEFLIVDVGGQRNERKKWIHCFEGVTAVIFVADASEYDKVLMEDGQTNRMLEALRLFEETVCLKWFLSTAFILFLNKIDLFLEKIQRGVPLSIAFPDYRGSNDYQDTLSFIQRQFETRTMGTQLYVHVTCATDTNNVEVVFSSVKDIIIQKHLSLSGLI